MQIRESTTQILPLSIHHIFWQLNQNQYLVKVAYPESVCEECARDLDEVEQQEESRDRDALDEAEQDPREREDTLCIKITH